MKIVIAGAGISGLSLAYILLKKEPSLEVEVLESAERPGGKIWTDSVNGFLCESGVNGFLDNKPKTLELIADLGLKPVRSNDEARKRFIFTENRLHVLPESPPAFFKSDLMSLKGRLRILYEFFAPRGVEEDETLETFAVRRLGREAYEKLIDPMASGIYAGDSTRLSLKSCFPRIYDLERTYGSLIRGMMKLKKDARKTGSRTVSAGPGGTLTSFRNGMQVLIDALKLSLGDRLRLDCSVASVEKKDECYNVFLENGEEIDADILVLATPAHVTTRIVKDMNKKISDLTARIPYPSVSVICLGFRKETFPHSLDGFGFLIPSKEGKRILGTLWDSSIFPNRASADHVLLRSVVGGARGGDFAMKADDMILKAVLDELKVVMGINAEPDFVKIYRHEYAIPQYNLGHQKILSEIDEAMGKCRGMYLAGNSYRGIGLNDCIENSNVLANTILGQRGEG